MPSLKLGVPLLKLWRKITGHTGPPPEVPGGNPFRREVPVCRQCQGRWNKTLDRLELYLPSRSRCLDLGPENPLGGMIARACDCRVENTAWVDLDLPYWHRNFHGPYDAVFAFEVLEHLFNPLGALLQAKSLLSEHGSIYVTHPRRPSFLSTRGHFHELDAFRWEELVKRAGLRIVREETFRHVPTWFTGVRPLLRWAVGRVYFAQLRKEKQDGR
jgi:hypothetical protein